MQCVGRATATVAELRAVIFQTLSLTIKMLNSPQHTTCIGITRDLSSDGDESRSGLEIVPARQTRPERYLHDMQLQPT